MKKLKSRLQTVEERITEMKNKSEVVLWNAAQRDRKLERKSEMQGTGESNQCLIQVLEGGHIAAVAGPTLRGSSCGVRLRWLMDHTLRFQSIIPDVC